MDIRGANIFKAGTWNKQTFTEEDLDQIATTFNELSQAGRVPLKFGHNEEQPFTDGQPALGWVSKIWRSGKDLYADFTDIPKVVYEAVRKGLYKFVSIELLKNAEQGGKRFPYVLDAVALLGADPPAVSGLEDLQKLALSRASFTFSEALAFTRQTNHSITGDSPDMDPKDLQKAIADAIAPVKAEIGDLSAKLKASETETAKFKAENEALKAKIATQEAEATKEKVKLAREAATLVLEAAVREKRITPAQRANFSKVLKIDDDAAVLALDMKDVEAMTSVTMEHAKKVMSTKQAFSRDPKEEVQNDGTAPDVCETLVSAARAQADKSGKDVFSAFVDSVRMNPKLGRSFLDFTFDQNA